MIGGIGPDMASLVIVALVIVALVIWVALLAWLSRWILVRFQAQYGWKVFDWRALGFTFMLLVGAIHTGNFILDLVERAVSGGDYPVSIGFPNIFLIASIALGVGIAATCENRRR